MKRGKGRWLLPFVGLFVGFWVLPQLLHTDLGMWGAGVCHRIAERSFQVDGRQLPLCARCTGLYLGFLTWVVVSSIRARGKPAGLPHWPVLVVMGLFLLLAGVDGLNSYLALWLGHGPLYPPHNALRVVTGSLEGVALAGFFWPILQLGLWEHAPEVDRHAGRDLPLVLLAVALLDGLALWHPRGSFYLLALLSLAGLLLALAILNALLLGLLLRRAGHVTSWYEAGTLLAWGGCLALLEVAGLSCLRYRLTGSFLLSLEEITTPY